MKKFLKATVRGIQFVTVLTPTLEDDIAAKYWPHLTRDPAKERCYDRETYFREALGDAVEIFGADFVPGMRRSALLLLKPDGLVAGKLRPTSTFLQDHGFRVVLAKEVFLGGHRWREMWRYQLTTATLDRLAVNECFLTAGPSLLLLLRHDAEDTLPATVRLAGLKGSADPLSRAPGTLRGALGQHNRVLSYVHAADEPADLIRELGVLSDALERRSVLARLAADESGPQGEEELAQALWRHGGAGRDLCSSSALTRVTRQVRSCAPGGPSALGPWTRLLDQMESMAQGARIDWRALRRDLEATKVQVDDWDLAALGADFTVHDEPEFSKTLGGPDLEAWSRAASAD
ncbi:nucleoside-diphosphate kinase [Streptomyces sp. Agncl-13]|uniref:nucleoside-diphosphate kinase n=1 Tax=Streptomyces sp. Agncl-13 TaxID=3400628 RepID=UPI003A857B52